MLHANLRRTRSRFSCALAVLAFACIANGCATPAPAPIPAAILIPPVDDLQLVEAYANPGAFKGAAIRWGGNIVQVNYDKSGNALVQVIERRLDANGRPIEGSASDGRFMIRATANVNPQLYARDRLITVAGTVDDNVTARVAGRTMPVVRVDEFMLWVPRWHGEPYWPYYDPWYAPYPYPWYGPGPGYWPYHGYWYGPRVNFGVGMSYYHHH